MNVVLDDAEEVWVKDTKARKVGDRQTLGAFPAPLFSAFASCLLGLEAQVSLAHER